MKREQPTVYSCDWSGCDAEGTTHRSFEPGPDGWFEIVLPKGDDLYLCPTHGAFVAGRVRDVHPATVAVPPLTPGMSKRLHDWYLEQARGVPAVGDTFDAEDIRIPRSADIVEVDPSRGAWVQAEVLIYGPLPDEPTDPDGVPLRTATPVGAREA